MQSIGIKNKEAEIFFSGNLQYMQMTKGDIFIVYIDVGCRKTSVFRREPHQLIQAYDDVCNAVGVR